MTDAADIRTAMREGQMRTSRGRFILEVLPGLLDGELERRGFELVRATQVLESLGSLTNWQGEFRVPAAPHGVRDTVEFQLFVEYSDMFRVRSGYFGGRGFDTGFGIDEKKPEFIAAQLMDTLLHGLRHAAATMLLADVGDLYVVARHLRHSSVSTTETYAKVNPERLTSALRKWADEAGAESETK